jgi:hypothetical protein
VVLASNPCIACTSISEFYEMHHPIMVEPDASEEHVDCTTIKNMHAGDDVDFYRCPT